MAASLRQVDVNQWTPILASLLGKMPPIELFARRHCSTIICRSYRSCDRLLVAAFLSISRPAGAVLQDKQLNFAGRTTPTRAEVSQALRFGVLYVLTPDLLHYHIHFRLSGLLG